MLMPGIITEDLLCDRCFFQNKRERELRLCFKETNYSTKSHKVPGSYSECRMSCYNTIGIPCLFLFIGTQLLQSYIFLYCFIRGLTLREQTLSLITFASMAVGDTLACTVDDWQTVPRLPEI